MCSYPGCRPGQAGPRRTAACLTSDVPHAMSGRTLQTPCYLLASHGSPASGLQHAVSCILGQAQQVCQPHSTPVTPAAIRNTIQKYDLKFKNSTALLGLPKAKKWSLYGECCTLLTMSLPSMTTFCVSKCGLTAAWPQHLACTHHVPAYDPHLMQSAWLTSSHTRGEGQT